MYEREVAKRFSDAYGIEVKRNIRQARDGGEDFAAGPFVVECKRRATLATIEGWYEQALTASIYKQCESDGECESHIPLVVARADGGASYAILSLADFLTLTRDRVRP